MFTPTVRRLIPAALVIALAASACNFATQPDPIIVTATPSNAALLDPATATVPYVTPTPPFVPTPTLPPDVAFADAEQALHNGDYVAAVAYFDAVLAQPDADPSLRAAARYGLGEAALREGLFAQAADALSRFILENPGDARLAHATFLRGDAYLGLSEWQLAVNDFQTYLTLRPGLIDSYVYERIGDAYLALGQPAQSLAAYSKAADATRELSSLVALRERVAAGYLNAGQPAQAIAQYDAILAVARNAPYRASIEYQAAQVQIGQGDVAGGHLRLQRIVRDYPETSPAYRALAILLGAGLQVDSYQQARINFANKDYNAAIQALNAHSSENGFSSVEALMMLGRAYREVGNVQAAITTFQTVLDTYPTDPVFGEAWLEQGRTLFLSGDVAGAIQKYTALATLHPDVPEGAEALWRAGYLYSTQGNTDAARSSPAPPGRMKGCTWARRWPTTLARSAWPPSFSANWRRPAAASFRRRPTCGWAVSTRRTARTIWLARRTRPPQPPILAATTASAPPTCWPGAIRSRHHPPPGSSSTRPPRSPKRKPGCGPHSISPRKGRSTRLAPRWKATRAWCAGAS